MPYAIPIKNIYYLLCYAWNRYQEGQTVAVAAINSPQLLDLFAKVLVNATNHLLRRGLGRDYVTVAEDTASLRGRILLSESVKRNLLKRGKAHCEYDDLQHNVLRNQIIKTTIQRLSRTNGLDYGLRHELALTARKLDLISTIPLTRRDFGLVQFHRNNGFYQLLIRICEMIHESLLPEEGTGSYKFPDILRDEMRMALLFEDFVRNFYRVEQSNYKVSRDYIHWDASSGSGMSLLPQMQTDITLRSASRTIIIDTKFHKETLQVHHGKLSIKSENLYQLFAYLKNLETRDEPDRSAEGVLLYPTVSRNIDESYKIQGHDIRIYTVDLATEWPAIHDRLLAILSEK